jgi:hypothetical protein
MVLGEKEAVRFSVPALVWLQLQVNPSASIAFAPVVKIQD